MEGVGTEEDGVEDEGVEEEEEVGGEGVAGAISRVASSPSWGSSLTAGVSDDGSVSVVDGGISALGVGASL